MSLLTDDFLARYDSKNVSNSYIYALVDPTTDNIRYIGKTSRNPKHRYTSHISSARYNTNTYLYRWIRLLLNNNKKPLMFVVEVCDTSIVSEREIYYIDFYKSLGCNLTNTAIGGTGGNVWNKLSDDKKVEIRKKLSLAGKRGGRKKGFITPKHVIDKIQATRKRRALEGYVCHKHSEETKRKLSDIKKADTKNSERLRILNAKNAIMIKGSKWSDERKANNIPSRVVTISGFIDPAGNIVSPVTNITKFCIINKLNRQMVYKLINGVISEYKGWKLYNAV